MNNKIVETDTFKNTSNKKLSHIITIIKQIMIINKPIFKVKFLSKYKPNTLKIILIIRRSDTMRTLIFKQIFNQNKSKYQSQKLN
jgi:hypothetical protein